MFLEVERNSQVGKYELVRMGLVHSRHGVSQRARIFDELAPRVDNLVFLVCDDDVQGGLAARMASLAAIIGFILRAAGIKSTKQYPSLLCYLI